MMTPQKARHVPTHGPEQQKYTSTVKMVVGTEVLIASKTLIFQTGEAPDFIDLTEHVEELVKETEIVAGHVLICSNHTTAAVIANEYEPLLLEDIAELFSRLIPSTEHYRYRHDDLSLRTVNLVPDEPANGHAHCQHLFLGPSIQFPVIDGRLELGPWQRIILVELDRPRTRQVVVQVNGVRQAARYDGYSAEVRERKEKEQCPSKKSEKRPPGHV